MYDKSAYFILLLPVLKQLHEEVPFLHQLRVHAFNFGKRQDGFQRALGLAGGPQATTGGGETVVHQALFVLDHLFENGRLAFHPGKKKKSCQYRCSIQTGQIWST